MTEEIKALVGLLVQDLMNEYKHMLFYLNAGCFIRGLAREELGEFLAKEARDEMNHVEQFTKMIIEIGGESMIMPLQFLDLPDVSQFITADLILKHVKEMEEEVVSRYVSRIEQVETLKDRVTSKYLQIFLEEQILDSKTTLAHVRQMMR